MEIQQIFQLMAGIGVLLFGINLFEQAIKVLWGNKLKSIIKKYTDGDRASIFTGFRTTSILQSSSLLSLLVLAFAGAGVLSLKSSVGLIFGANIGSPVLPFLAALIGFGTFKISAFAFPLLAIWWLSFIFNLSEKWEQRAKLLVWFWLLFIGLDFMKESVDIYRATAETSISGNLSLRWYGALGIIATVVIQSSGALGIMTLAALDGGIISFPASVAIAMGANIGTTVTAVIGSLGGSRIKRQIATSHVLFNLFSWIIGILLFRQYIWFTNEILWFADSPVMGNAVLNIIFNASTAILFWFFLVPFTKLVERIMPTLRTAMDLRIKDTKMKKHWSAFSIAELYALHADSKTLVDHIFTYNSYVFGFDKNTLLDKKSNVDDLINKPISWDKKVHAKQYADIKYISDLMFEYVLPLKIQKLPKSERHLIEQIETGMYAGMRSAKSIKNIYHDLQDLKSSDNKTMQELYQKVQHNAAVFYKHVARVIDRKYTKDNFEELTSALQTIKKDHKNFVDYLTKTITKKLTKKELEDIDVATLLNLDHYLYQSAKTLVSALQNVYLDPEEEKIFKKLKMVEEG